MKVSIIIPTFNRSELLIKTIQSLSLQDYPKSLYEIIIVDNKSTDRTKDEILRYIKNSKINLDIKYVYESRPGIVFSRHTGAVNAIGEILIFGDDDGIYETNWITEILEVYRNYPIVGAVGTKIDIKWDKQAPLWIWRYEELLGKLSYGEGVTIKDRGLYINGGSFSIKKEILFLLGGFNVGQVGDYLLGDCEAGLCRKLHKRKIPIAFTDNTTMWHVQFVDKQGKIEDIKRRFINNGIADAYMDLFVLENVNKINSIKIKEKKLRIKLFWLTFVPVFRNKKLNFKFQLSKYKSYIEYHNILQNDLKLIEYLKNEEWILSDTYQYPMYSIFSSFNKSIK